MPHFDWGLVPLIECDYNFPLDLEKWNSNLVSFGAIQKRNLESVPS